MDKKIIVFWVSAFYNRRSVVEKDENHSNCQPFRPRWVEKVRFVWNCGCLQLGFMKAKQLLSTLQY